MKSLSHSFKKFFFKDKCILCPEKANDNLYYMCYNCYKNLKNNGKLKQYNDIYYLWDYDKNMKKIISEYKLKNKLYIGELLHKLISKELDWLIKDENIDIIIPIPASKKRVRERGFNQVEELLKFGEYNYINMERVKNTKHMYEILDVEKRKDNIKSAFKIKSLEGKKKILIIDDIVTTGATMKEFISEIREKNKTIEIVIFTLALSKTAKKINLKMR